MDLLMPWARRQDELLMQHLVGDVCQSTTMVMMGNKIFKRDVLSIWNQFHRLVGAIGYLFGDEALNPQIDEAFNHGSFYIVLIDSNKLSQST